MKKRKEKERKKRFKRVQRQINKRRRVSPRNTKLQRSHKLQLMKLRAQRRQNKAMTKKPPSSQKQPTHSKGRQAKASQSKCWTPPPKSKRTMKTSGA